MSQSTLQTAIGQLVGPTGGGAEQLAAEIIANAIAVGSHDGRRSKYGARARQLTGITDETLACVSYSDLGNTFEYSFAGIAGGTSLPNIPIAGGVRIVGGGAGQGGTVNYNGFGAIFSIASMALKRWYMFHIWRIWTNVPNANSRFYGLFGPGSMAGCVAVGFNGTVQTAKYAFSAGAADASTASPALNVLSTVSPVVGPLVVGEIWFDGDGVFGSINGEPPVRVANPIALPNNVSTPPQFESRQFAAGQTDAIDVDAGGLWVEG